MHKQKDFHISEEKVLHLTSLKHEYRFDSCWWRLLFFLNPLNGINSCCYQHDRPRTEIIPVVTHISRPRLWRGSAVHVKQKHCRPPTNVWFDGCAAPSKFRFVLNSKERFSDCGTDPGGFVYFITSLFTEFYFLTTVMKGETKVITLFTCHELSGDSSGFNTSRAKGKFSSFWNGSSMEWAVNILPVLDNSLNDPNLEKRIISDWINERPVWAGQEQLDCRKTNPVRRASQ